MSWKWAKVDDKGVARFVSPEASKYIQLSVGPLDLVNHTDGPLPLIKAIYNDALERGVITDPTKLLPFIDGQAYLTVECTGFAHSKCCLRRRPRDVGAPKRVYYRSKERWQRAVNNWTGLSQLDFVDPESKRR